MPEDGGQPATKKAGIKRKEVDKELELVPFIDMLSVLVSFLLMSVTSMTFNFMQVNLPSTGGGGQSKKDQEDKLSASVLKLTILMSNSGIRLAGGGSILSLMPKVTDPQTGEQEYHLRPLPGEENLPLDQRPDLQGKLLSLRKQIEANPNLKEDTVIIACDPDIIYKDIIDVMDLCHSPDIAFTNTMLSPGFVGG
jgi:biopolymer transport protein ExbD